MSAVLHIRHRIANMMRDRAFGKPNALDEVDTSEMADEAPMFRWLMHSPVIAIAGIVRFDIDFMKQSILNKRDR
ncbi:hypothetical protein PAAG_04295 [Paracoccidioides lutzii Pb01]|uniref:Uncharacterized protein n=1 Tax=Paracoccidioides lutzii (strain ATCC MYA-826 / Pb01) TaxID=502779 RepID=C1H0K1_PARBA|nr:hypothetical protein PAAG_04295 [Paracoccidioides lutzii Pb01]EEH33242.2 hypothetical protein PAAG_04295 [Paracoccidioides lutzii Pb01]